MSKNKAEKQNIKKKRGNIFTLLFLLLLLFAVIFTVFSFFMGGAKFTKDVFLATLKTPLFYIISGAAFAMLFIYSLVNFRLSEKKNVSKENDLNDSHFMSDKELERSPSYVRMELSKLNDYSDGIPLRACVRGKKTEVVFLRQPIHANVIGSTGTGKTTGYIDPIIQIYPRFKTKPCMIITDPKGELYRKHSNYLKNQGYVVLCVDYRNPYSSAKPNPFQPVIDRIREIRQTVQNDRGKYTVAGQTYQTYPEAETHAKALRQTLKDEINLYLDDIAQTLFPTDSKQDPSWEDGARDLILALMYALTDDVLWGRMPEEKLCLHNLYYLLSNYASESGIEELRAYFEAHKENLIAFSKAQTVLTASDRMLTSFISTMMRFANYLSDAGIRCMTSGNDISFANFDKEPTAVFVIFPDEIVTRHRFVSLFLIQAYKMLVNTAEKNMQKGLTDDMKLLRNCYFIMDEFGNLPKLPRLDDVLSIARSRKIFFLCVLQSYAQLDTVYSEKPAEKILSQLQVKIFIGTDDMKTLKAFSELCGKKKIVTLSASVAIGRESSDSYSAKEQPLISPQELQLLCKDLSGEAIISCLGQYPIKSAFTPSYKATSVYSIGNANDDLREPEIFDEHKYEHDIRLNMVQPKVDTLLLPADEANDDITAFSLTQEEIDMLNAEELKRDIIAKAESKLQSLILTKSKKLLFIKDYLPEGIYDKLSELPPKETVRAIETLLASDADLMLYIRLELSSLIVLCRRIEDAQKEYESLNKGAGL